MKLIIIVLIITILFCGCFEQKQTQEKILLKEEINNECFIDKYNCDDFETQQQAQIIFKKCPTDIHQLDRDKDGKACEKNQLILIK